MQSNIGMGDHSHSLSTSPAFPAVVPPSSSAPPSGAQGQGQQMPATPVNSGSSVQQAPPPEAAQQFCLRWNSFPATIATQLGTLRAAEDFVDVTLACDGRQLRAHKLVLSACSPYFMQLFKSTPCQHPVIFLRDVGFRQLVALLEFMYAGEVNVSQVELPALLRTAEALQVRGLADTTANNNNNNNSFPPAPKPQPGFSPNYGQILGEPVINPNPTVPAPTISEEQPENTLNNNSCPSNEVPAPTTIPPPVVIPTSSSSSSSTLSTSNNPSIPSKREIRNSINEIVKRNAEEEDSESNESNDFDMMDVVQSKVDSYINNDQLSNRLEDTGQIFPDDPSGVPFDMNEPGLITDPLMDETHSEDSSEEDSDDDDGECKEFTYQSDASYSQEGIVDGEGGNQNGENIAGPSGLSGAPGGESAEGVEIKEDTGGTDTLPTSGRNRLSRSLWPPGIPYHGPQQCPYCPRVLSNVGNWRKHVLTMHFAREKVYKCRHCSSAFRTAEYLQKHYVRVHNYPQKMTRRKYAEQT